MVPGKVKGKQRPRVMKGGWTYTPRATKEYMAHVSLCASNAAAKSGWEMVQKVPVSIKLKFVFEIPKSRKELRVGMPHLQKPDIDNCEKGITDSLSGILYKDDCLIWKVKGMVKVWGKSPRAEVEVETN